MRTAKTEKTEVLLPSKLRQTGYVYTYTWGGIGLFFLFYFLVSFKTWRTNSIKTRQQTIASCDTMHNMVPTSNSRLLGSSNNGHEANAYLCRHVLIHEPLDGFRLNTVQRGRNSAIGMMTSYGLDDRGVRVRVPVGARIFSASSRPVLGPTQPPIQWVPRALSPGVKRQGREVDHSLPASAEVKKMWIYTSTPPYTFMV
jgi:hypothetical protein